MTPKQTFWCMSGSCVALGLFANPPAFMCSLPGRCWAEQLCLTSKLPSASCSLIAASNGLRISPKSWSSSNQRDFPSPFPLKMENLPSASACTKVATASFIDGWHWFRRGYSNFSHFFFFIAELHGEPHSPPLLLVPWEAFFVNTKQAGFALVPRPRKREKNNPKQLQSFHLRN